MGVDVGVCPGNCTKNHCIVAEEAVLFLVKLKSVPPLIISDAANTTPGLAEEE